MIISGWSEWLRLMLGLFLVFALFQWSAEALGSDRGQAGLIVGALVVAATLGVERVLFGQHLAPASRAVGLGWPRRQGLVFAAGLCVLLVVVIPVFAQATGASVAVVPQWWALLPGLFAQGGIAEETLFRGFLFGHVRRGRSFWSAARVSMLPFVAVHLLLFATMPWPIALAAVLLATHTLVSVGPPVRIGWRFHLATSHAPLRHPGNSEGHRHLE